MPNLVNESHNTGSVHLEDNLYADETLAVAPAGTYLAGTLVTRVGVEVDADTATEANAIGVLGHDVEHDGVATNAVRILYSGKIRSDHIYQQLVATPVVLTAAGRDALRAIGVNPIDLFELND